MKKLVNVSIPAPVLEELLRRNELHIEQLQCLDDDSQRVLRGSLKRSLLTSRRRKPA